MTAPFGAIAAQLNPEQLAAVTHGDGPQLVIAGAGSGKTRVITYRIAWLVHECRVDPGSIVAVTFTNKAAGEMKERVQELLGLDSIATFVGTFHRYSLTLLRRWGERVGLSRDFSIFDGKDQIALVKKALQIEGLAESAFPPRTMLSAISAAKNRLFDPATFEDQADDYFSRKVAAVYRRYQGLLEHASAVDFDDMLRLAVRLLDEEEDLLERLRSRLRYLLVDEFQDTNHAQLRLVHALIGATGSITAVGDEDQGIYRWRGAELANILRFEESFPGAEVRKLERNYRSTQTILDASGELVAHNRSRRGKVLWTDAGEGDPVELYRSSDEVDEARWVIRSLQQLRPQYSLAEMSILVRTHAQTRAFEEELLRAGLPYVLVAGTRFYDRAEVKDVVAYLRVMRNPRDSWSLSRILNQPPRGIGKTTQLLLEGRANELRTPHWDVLLHDEMGSFPGRARRALLAFRDLVLGLQKHAAGATLLQTLERLLADTGYAELYSGGSDEDVTRLENVGELLSAAQELPAASELRGMEAVTAFLDHIALVSDVDEWSTDRGISLMTLHAAKGLEFPVVVVSGIEEGLLPHFNSQDSADAIEEERRLLYVGMTRARSRLLLTCCRRRRIAGRFQDQRESPFLAEIPARCLAVSRSPELFAGPRTRSVHDFFGRPPGAATRRVESLPGAPPEGELAQGSRVRHPSLGEGLVLTVHGPPGDRRMTVLFERAGKRTLLERFAQLEILTAES